ncbi:MAG: methyltransferase domain-containing protein [Dehalococcoidales bacterium]|nr:methyltransferase domain-containing protein [Dehalococcoidales bacterium]
MTHPYQYLSRVYDTGWSDFPIQYLPLVNELLEERGIFPARILDLACGTGALAVALARCGHTVRGLDSSPEMIRIAKSKATGIPDVRFETGDMVEFESDGPYDVVTCTYDSINYIRRITNLKKLFRKIGASLKEKGLFIFDSNTIIMYRHQAGSAEPREVDGETVLEETGYNARYKLATTTFSFPDGTYEIHRQRPYNFDELSPLLEGAGLRVIDRFSWFSRLPYVPASPKVFIVAEKT